MKSFLHALAVAAIGACAAAAHAEEIGEVDTVFKLVGPDHKIVVDAHDDPKVQGVTCYVSRAKTGGIKGALGLAEDRSEASIACRQTGPITIHEISFGAAGEEVFKQGISLIWKKQVVNRIYDKANDTLIYLAHSRQVQDGSAKMSMSTVPLYGQTVTWEKGKPE